MLCKSKRVNVTNAGGIVKLFDADRSRRHVVLYAEVLMMVGGSDLTDNNGLVVPAGAAHHVPAPACEAEMWVRYNQAGTFQMSVLEYVD